MGMEGPPRGGRILRDGRIPSPTRTEAEVKPVVDVHTHFFSRAYFEARAAESPLPGTPAERLARALGAAGIDLPDADVAAHRARWIAEFDRHEVEHAVTFASSPDEAPVVAEAVAGSRGRLTGFALVNPLAPDAAETTEGHFSRLGLRGILLFPALHRFRTSGPEAAEVLRVVDRHRGVAVVHCGILHVKVRDLLGLPKTTDLSFANPLDLVPAANAFPSARFVVPHFGAGFLRETLMAGTQCENVLVDTSSSNAWIATQVPALDLTETFRRALAVFGPDRVLFGTDSSTFPRGWRKDLHAAQVDALRHAGASDADQRKVFRENARRLLGL
jgi:predicted TIM-barrel fold metal-dependent hydrolase